ncbi:hypothetical protein ACJX0J_036234 [Zea mays]
MLCGDWMYFDDMNLYLRAYMKAHEILMFHIKLSEYKACNNEGATSKEEEITSIEKVAAETKGTKDESTDGDEKPHLRFVMEKTVAMWLADRLTLYIDDVFVFYILLIVGHMQGYI